MKKDAKIAIVGGGIAGASAALYLGQLGVNVTLFEKEDSLVSGPPMCHLHAGGNLYREIDDAQCVALLKQSIELLRFYPHAVDFRPTVIATPLGDPQSPNELLTRLELLKEEYAKLIEKDSKNEVLKRPDEYYKVYTKEDLLELKNFPTLKKPKALDEWMIIAAKNMDLEKLQYPVIMVQEYGLNMFRISASASLALNKLPNARVFTNTYVSNIASKKESFSISYEHDGETNTEKFDYLINAAGFRTGKLDDMLSHKRERLVEFKASYVVKWKKEDALWPEIIFHGQRGTPQGMAQFTPYYGGYFQLHGMTENITLFENGLVHSTQESSHPELDNSFVQKIEDGWDQEDLQERTSLAVEHLAQYMPSFSDATLASKPLFGAQQIPGRDKTLRASEVSFESSRYARCEIVKASSILTMADAITKELVKLGILDNSSLGSRNFEAINSLTPQEITALAQKVCQSREYPTPMAEVNCPLHYSFNCSASA